MPPVNKAQELSGAERAERTGDRSTIGALTIRTGFLQRVYKGYYKGSIGVL